ncbi:hypothetical protein E8L99_16605 [Phreatobacter aquaticus]|uniref:Uncharacterized protein n=1 Tax=Phreatobacter aquaticus TaxID=2570229 RepID=A0A4D7QMR5_9HYPH|nr:hypothetical protein [Phreatobacter aquaticus]QCK87263.1 hypothetical protein E8L99_16605 [Phreatobacter aquaticus]
MTIEVWGFSFEELSAEAKSRARAWFIEHSAPEEGDPVILVTDHMISAAGFLWSEDGRFLR